MPISFYRVFVGIKLTPAAEDTLISYQQQLRTLCEKGRYTSRGNLHVTLHFIGNVQRYEGLLNALTQIQKPPFTLWLDHLGVFQKRDGDVVYAGCRDSAELDTLHKQVLQLLGVSQEYVYTPHVTLGRNIRGLDQDGLRRTSDQLVETPIGVEVSSVHLLWSHQVANKLIYSSLHESLLT